MLRVKITWINFCINNYICTAMFYKEKQKKKWYGEYEIVRFLKKDWK